MAALISASTITPARVLVLAWAVPCVYIIGDLLFEKGNRLDITPLTAAICFLGIISTLAGCGFARIVRIGRYDLTQEIQPHYFVVLSIIAAMGVVGGYLAIAAWARLGIGIFSGGAEVLYEMNAAYREEGGLLSGVAGRLYALLPILLMLTVYLRRHSVISRSSALLFSIVALTLMISPRRAMLITSSLAAALMLYQARRLSLSRVAVVGVVGCVVLISFFGYTQFYLGKINSLEPIEILGAFFLYFNSSIYVMNALVETSHFSDTWIALNLPARAVNVIFGTGLNVDLSVPFVYSPEPSNTVPAYYYYYKSLGFPGVFIWSFCVGFGATMALRLYEATRSFAWCSISAMMMAGMLLSIRENFFFSYDFIYWVVMSFAVSTVVSKRFRLR